MRFQGNGYFNSLSAKGKLPLVDLPRNNVIRITDSPDMTSAVDRGLKQHNKHNSIAHLTCLTGSKSDVQQLIFMIR